MSYEEVSLNSSEQISAPIYKAPTKAVKYFFFYIKFFISIIVYNQRK